MASMYKAAVTSDSARGAAGVAKHGSASAAAAADADADAAGLAASGGSNAVESELLTAQTELLSKLTGAAFALLSSVTNLLTVPIHIQSRAVSVAGLALLSALTLRLQGSQATDAVIALVAQAREAWAQYNGLESAAGAAFATLGLVSRRWVSLCTRIAVTDSADGSRNNRPGGSSTAAASTSSSSPAAASAAAVAVRSGTAADAAASEVMAEVVVSCSFFTASGAAESRTVTYSVPSAATTVGTVRRRLAATLLTPLS